MPTLTVGVAATKARWSAVLRSHIRDHSEGIAVEVVMDRTALRRAQSRIDVLVVDDVMRSFSVADVSTARDAGAYVIGMFDDNSGMGRQYLLGLGVDKVMDASTSPDELAAVICQVRPRQPARTNPNIGPVRGAGGRVAGARNRKRGFVSVWTKVSGGAGLTEAVVAAAEHLAKSSRVLVIEAEEVAPVLVSRLLRSPEGGLPWALSRVRQGLPALPEGLSGARDDGAPPLGRFDAICAAPGAAQGATPGQMEKLVAEAATIYDHVLVETNWLTGAPLNRDRSAAVTSVLQGAGSIVVLAAADPQGAVRLVQWKAWAMAGGVGAACWAAFGRARKGRYEREHLRALVQANTGRHGFAGFSFLPEDHTVMRARWNVEMAWKGPWQVAVRDLVASSLAGTAPALVPGAPSRQTASIAVTVEGKTTGAIAT